MTDYKSMYYHLAGRTATTVDVLDMSVKTLNGTLDAMKETIAAISTTAEALGELTEKLKLAQQTTEEMFITSSDNKEETE